MGLTMKACQPLRCRSVEKRGGWVPEGISPVQSVSFLVFFFPFAHNKTVTW